MHGTHGMVSEKRSPGVVCMVLIAMVVNNWHDIWFNENVRMCYDGERTPGRVLSPYVGVKSDRR